MSWLAIAVGAIFYCRHYWQEAPGVSLYVEAARCLLDGLPLQGCNPTYTYPPVFALMTIPLVPLPPVMQNLVWYLVTIGSLILCVTLSADLVRRIAPAEWSQRDLAWLYAVGILLSLKFIFAAIGNQSYDAQVVLLVLVGLSWLANERSTAAGAALALAAALKATPLLFLPYLVFKHHYRAAAVMAVVLVVAAVLPDLLFAVGRKPLTDSYLLAWMRQVAEPALTEKLFGNPHTFWYSSNPNNNSLRGLVGIFVDDYNNPTFKPVIYAVDAAYSAVVALIIWRTRNAVSAVAIDGSLLAISMLMLSPMTSQSHYVAMILPIFAVVAVWRKGTPSQRLIAGLFLIVNLALMNATSRDLVGHDVTEWAREHRLLAIDALLFLAFFAYLVIGSRRSEAPFRPAATIEESTI